MIIFIPDFLGVTMTELVEVALQGPNQHPTAPYASATPASWNRTSITLADVAMPMMQV